MTNYGIITRKGIDEVVTETVDKPKIIVGIGDGKTKKERKAIARAFVDEGYEVYATPELWPNDSYIQLNGLFVPEQLFGRLGHGGNYIFGEDFVLVSQDIREDFEREFKSNLHFRKFFDGKDIYFIETYERDKSETRIDNGIPTPYEIIIKLRHIDMTIGYIPKRRLLTISRNHYSSNPELVSTSEITSIDDFVSSRGIELFVTEIDPKRGFHSYPHNYYVVDEETENPFVLANRYGGFDEQLRARGVNARSPNIDIFELLQRGGSIRCITNQVPSLKILDALGIDYRRWGIDPRQLEGTN